MKVFLASKRSSHALIICLIDSSISLRRNIPKADDLNSGSIDLKLRILLVDDAVLCRKFHRRILAPSCHEILEASNGQEAVERVRESMQSGVQIDGILMDSSMPFMNGTTAAKLIREMGFEGLIFGVTGNAFQSDIDDFIAHGVNEVLIKPLSVERYSYIVNCILNKAADGDTSMSSDANWDKIEKQP